MERSPRLHIRPDLVLIYRKPDDESLELVRLGSHGELGGDNSGTFQVWSWRRNLLSRSRSACSRGLRGLRLTHDLDNPIGGGKSVIVEHQIRRPPGILLLSKND